MEIFLLFYFLLVGGLKNIQPTPIVKTSCGNVEGSDNGIAYSFKGIPYALPPVGTRRWKPPIPLSQQEGSCWKGTYRAINFQNTCIQRHILNAKHIIGSEDCLYLNVWTPTLNINANLPVMVWIHGGSLQELSANWPTYSPTEELARDTDVVYVGMNYRLHAFGFMALDILSAQSPHNTSGNYGLMDQILAMKWTKENIKYFGGDPSQVTVFGQSSGGTSVLALLASPLARNLFQKAWLLSASPILNKTTAEASRDNEVFLRNIGCTTLSCLLGRTSQQIVEAVPWEEYPYWVMPDQLYLPTKNLFYGAIAVADGYVVEKPPLKAWNDRTAIDVPLLIGTTAQETDFDPANLDLNSWTWDDYEKHVKDHLGPFGENILQNALKYYPNNTSTPECQYSSIGADVKVNCLNDILALTAAINSQSPVYRYIVTSKPSSPVAALRTPFSSSCSFHMWDLFAYFGTIKDYINPPSQSDMLFQANIRREILSFVQSGKPFSKNWVPFSQSTALLSGSTSIMTVEYHREQCSFWQSSGLLSYSWIN